MPSMDEQTPYWSYAPPVARLECGPLAAEVDVERPQLGLQQLSWHAKPLALQALGVRWETDESSPTQGRDPHWPMRPAEAYVRAGDLVATYLAEPAWPYRPQIYWRADVLDGVPQALASLSLLVSIQTDLLDTRPQLGVVSHVAAEELVHVAVSERDHAAQSLTGTRTHVLEPGAGAHCLVARLPGGETSYVECVPATDFQEARISPADDETNTSKLQWHLFNEFLEKGVIRRARVHMFFLPQKNDVELAVECYRLLSARPLPLTT
jgi:hypothetical protein